MSDFWLDPLSTSILHVSEQRGLWWDCADAWAFAGRLCNRYHNLMRWLNMFYLHALFFSYVLMAKILQVRPAGNVVRVISAMITAKVRYTYIPYLTLWDKISQNLTHLEANSHKIFKSHRIFRPSYNTFYEEININHTLLCLSQASYI